jgi:TonB family protein
MISMRGFTIMVATIVSTVLHFFILTLLDTIPLISKEIPQRNLYMVDLIPLPAERPAPQKEEAAVPKQATEVKKEEVKKEEVKKEEPKKETVKHEEKKDTVVLEDPNKKKTTPEKATAEKSTKEGKEKPTNNDEQQQLAAAIKGIEQNVEAREQGDSSATEVTAAESKDYENMVSEKVAGFWAILNIWSEEELEAKVVLMVDEKGQVTPRFDEPSGNPAFDDAVRRAISRAAPFPPPPGKKPINIPRRFSSSR